MPGGGGVRLKYSNPMCVDDVAADFPELDIILAHPSFPWQDEALAIAVHKPNVYIDLSGWSPKYFPENLIQYTNTPLKHKMLFGSDFPLITPDRWLADFEKLDDPRRGPAAGPQGERRPAARACAEPRGRSTRPGRYSPVDRRFIALSMPSSTTLRSRSGTSASICSWTAATAGSAIVSSSRPLAVSVARRIRAWRGSTWRSDEAAALEPGQDLDHRLRGDQRPPGQLGVGQARAGREHRQRRVLLDAQSDLGQARAHLPPDPLVHSADDVDQRRRP